MVLSTQQTSSSGYILSPRMECPMYLVGQLPHQLRDLPHQVLPCHTKFDEFVDIQLTISQVKHAKLANSNVTGPSFTIFYVLTIGLTGITPHQLFLKRSTHASCIATNGLGRVASIQLSNSGTLGRERFDATLIRLHRNW